MDRKTADKITKELGLGATGKFPMGKKLTPADEGELKSVITEEKGMIVIVFGKSVRWVSMSPDNALDMAKELVERAMKLKMRSN